ncbi:tetratricopeptide repeat protein [Xanthocytophaga flava]|uniref:tetratricopeptide repeat protein n=1 Tax=Xanthocytophaga flava TaxID=3048013 RepID=UPI0028D0A294|nr:tetratricopeptide repeat protein [Xanthocytophaga flavus]MDJ1470789.1 tetratricopeptide repeat protein [Xanthocytophaga flavus]
MAKVLACFLFLWVVTLGMTQVAIQSETDSLISLLSKPLDDTLKARTYKKIAEQYSVSDLTKAMAYAHQGLDHVTRMKWKKGIAVFYTILGGLHNEKGEYTEALTYLQKAYTIHNANQDQYNKAATLNSIGSTYQRSSRFQQAIDSYIKALQIAEQLKDNYLISLCLDNIAIVYNNQNHFDKALTYHLKSLQFISPQDTARFATGYASIATTYVNKKDTTKAHDYYEKALTLYKETGDSIGIATVYTNFSVIESDYYQRMKYKLQAQRIWNKQSPANTLSLSNIGNIAIEYLHLAQSDTLARVKASCEVPANRAALLQKAAQYLELGITLSQDANDQGNLAFLRGLRAELAAEKGDFRKAYTDMQFYHTINDSLFSQETKNQIAETESKYELGKKNAEIAIQQLTIANQQKIRLGLLIGIGLLAVIGGLLYW